MKIKTTLICKQNVTLLAILLHENLWDSQIKHTTKLDISSIWSVCVWCIHFAYNDLPFCISLANGLLCHDTLPQELYWRLKILICWLDWQCLCQSWLTDQLSVSSDKHRVGNQAKTQYTNLSVNCEKIYQNQREQMYNNAVVPFPASHLTAIKWQQRVSFINTTHEAIVYIYTSWKRY